jgi:hypothetical protein
MIDHSSRPHDSFPNLPHCRSILLCRKNEGMPEEADSNQPTSPNRALAATTCTRSSPAHARPQCRRSADFPQPLACWRIFHDNFRHTSCDHWSVISVAVVAVANCIYRPPSIGSEADRHMHAIGTHGAQPYPRCRSASAYDKTLKALPGTAASSFLRNIAGARMSVTTFGEEDIQEFLKEFPPLPGEENVSRYWMGSVIGTIIVAVWLAAFFLNY